MSILTRLLNLLRRPTSEPPAFPPPQPVRPTIDWDLVLPVAWRPDNDWRTVWVPMDMAMLYVATVEAYSRRLRRIATEGN